MFSSLLKNSLLTVAFGCLIVLIIASVSYQPSLDKRPSHMPSGLYFLWVQTVYDPVLALPGTDTNQLQDSIEALRKGMNIYLDAYQQPEQELIISTLHPFQFLNSLASLEKSRREFVERPSYLRAAWYHLSLLRSLGLMREYSGRLSDTVHELPISYGLSMPAGITTKQHLANTLADAYINADGQITEVWRRSRCAIGYGSDCGLRLPLVSVSSLSVKREKRSDEQYAKALKEFLFGPTPFSPLSLTDTNPERLPLVLVPEPACTRASQATYLFMWSHSRTSGQPAFWATPVNEILFHETANSMEEFSVNLAEAGVEYAYQSMSPYLCTDYSLDIGAVRTAYLLSQKLKSPVLGNYIDEDLPPTLLALKDLERTVAEPGDIIDITDVESYIQGLQDILYNPDADLGPVSEPDRRRLFEVVTVWLSKSGWIESEISRIDDMAMTNRYVLRVTTIPIESLFVYRSYYSTLLLAGNETIHQTPLRFIEQRADTYDSLGDMLIYQSDLEESIPSSELPDLLFQEGKRSEDVYTIDDFRYE